MKVCFFNRSYWPDQAATGQLLTELAEDLVSRFGDEVTVVAGRALNAARADREWRLSPVTREERNGVSIRRANGTLFRPSQIGARIANYVTYFSSAGVAALGVGRPDVVVSLTDPPIIGLLALWTARRTGARFVFVCEDVFPEVASLVEEFENSALNAALDRINRYLLRHADAIVALGDRMRRRLVDEKGADPSRIRIIHNWADCDAIVPGPKDNYFSRANGLTNRFVVMHSGNVGLSQNLDVLVEAAARLRSLERLTVAIVGDGSKRAALQQMAAGRGLDHVRFFPYQPKEMLHDSFSAADVLIVSLKAGIEGYIVPSKIYGILAAGRPFVAAMDPSAEPAVIARDTGAGLVADAGDPDALANAIVTLYNSPDLAKDMGMRARQAARQFDRKIAIQAYHDLFSGLARPRSAS